MPCRVRGSTVELLRTGSCRIVASHAGSATHHPASTTGEFTVARGRHLIDFPSPGQVVFPDSRASVQLRATSSAGLPLTFVPGPGSVASHSGVGDGACVVTDSGQVSLDTGQLPITCSVGVEHPGDDDWLPATSGPVQFRVPPLVTEMGLDGDPTFTDEVWTVRIRTDGLGISVVEALTPSVCSVSDWTNVGGVDTDREGDHTYTVSVARIAAGACRIEALSELDGHYFNSQNLTVVLEAP